MELICVASISDFPYISKILGLYPMEVVSYQQNGLYFAFYTNSDEINRLVKIEKDIYTKMSSEIVLARYF